MHYRGPGYSYDPNGNRTHLTYPDGRVVTSTYDLADRLSAVTDWDGRTTTYSYDAANRQTGIGYPNGVIATYDYDPADRLLSIVHNSPVSGTIAVFTYTLDAVGNRLNMDDRGGSNQLYLRRSLPLDPGHLSRRRSGRLQLRSHGQPADDEQLGGWS